MIQPNVAINEPGIPATFVPTKVEAFKAIGPGVICEIVRISMYSVLDNQLFCSTTCS